MLSNLHLGMSSPLSSPSSPVPPEETKRARHNGHAAAGKQAKHGKKATARRGDEEAGLLNLSDTDDDSDSDSDPRVHAGAGLYQSWLPKDSSPLGWIYSAVFAGGSIGLNVMLVVFLLWSQTQPKCADPWLTQRSHAESLSARITPPSGQDLPPIVRMPQFSEVLEEKDQTIHSDKHLDHGEIEVDVHPPAPATHQEEPQPTKPTIKIEDHPALVTKKHEEEEHHEEPKHEVEDHHEEPKHEPEHHEEPKHAASSSSSSTSEEEKSPGVKQSDLAQKTAKLVGSVDEFQSSFDVATSHHHVWSYCAADFALDPKVDWKKSQLGAPPAKFCPETMTNEQLYQLTWFGHHVAQGHESPQRFVPPFLDCIHLPPAGYVWPKKHPELPSPGDAVHWPNLRASQRTDLVEFNRGTPKNLYHFEAGVYDKDGLDELSIAAKYIPLQKKVRNMLDIGAGGGSLGVLLKAKYNIQTIASAFADWPYCEYMTERGELCLMLDVMEAMPFAKFSFDMIHISWVYHGQRPEELWEFLHEVDRIIRPGGYLYMRGGWSNSQIVAQRSMLSWLGYTLLHEVVSNKPAAVTAKVSFGEGLPYHADWTAIYVKPIRASPADPAFCEGKAKQERNGKVVEPLPVRTPPTNMGNVYEQ